MLASGTLTIGAAGATFNFPAGMFQWSGGMIEGNGSTSSPSMLANTGAITLTGSGTKTLYSGLTLDNSGTIIDDGTGSFAFQYYAVLNNLSGGLVDMASSESISINSANGGAAGNAINNEAGAIFESSSTSSNSDNNVPFNSQGVRSRSKAVRSRWLPGLSVQGPPRRSVSRRVQRSILPEEPIPARLPGRVQERFCWPAGR